MSIKFNKAYFIKLGEGGKWEKECLEKGTLRLGFSKAPDKLCRNGNWPKIQKFWTDLGKTSGVAKDFTRQIQTFYEADGNTIFITFYDGKMWWCKPKGSPTRLEDGSKTRKTIGGWKDKSFGGNKLETNKLSGRLLKTQRYQGTICEIKKKNGAADYLSRKLNDRLLKEVKAAEQAESDLMKAAVDMMRQLTWQDFELFVDLIFSSSGWRRISVLGKGLRTVDIELELPTTRERAFIQVKSETNQREFKKYINNFTDSEKYTRMFFTWHTGDIRLPNEANSGKIHLIGPIELGRLAVDAGMTSWLREKV